MGIYAALADMTKEAVLQEHGGSQFSSFKPALADLANEKLSPITGEMARLMEDTTYIGSVLQKGSQRASAIAQPVVARVKEIVGFI